MEDLPLVAYEGWISERCNQRLPDPVFLTLAGQYPGLLEIAVAKHGFDLSRETGELLTKTVDLLLQYRFESKALKLIES